MNSTQTLTLQSGLAELQRLSDGAKTLWQSGQLGACWPLVKEQLSVVSALETAIAESPNRPPALVGISADLKELCKQVFDGEEASRARRGHAEPATLLAAFELLERWSRTVEEAAFPRPRWRRWVKPLVVFVGIGALVVGWRLQPTVRASASHSPVYAASFAADEIDATEWLLPDATLGWLEIRFPKARDVQAVELKNSINRPYRDRASNAVRVELLNEEEQLASQQARFLPIPAEEDGAGQWLRMPIRANGATRVRVHVDSHYGVGGGLAEVVVR